MYPQSMFSQNIKKNQMKFSGFASEKNMGTFSYRMKKLSTNINGFNIFHHIWFKHILFSNYIVNITNIMFEHAED